MKIGPVRHSPPANLVELYRQTRHQQIPHDSPDRSDSVSISRDAMWLSRLLDMPETRAEKVQRVRQQIDAGTYDVEQRLDKAVDRMIDELPLSDLGDSIQKPRFI